MGFADPTMLRRYGYHLPATARRDAYYLKLAKEKEAA